LTAEKISIALSFIFYFRLSHLIHVAVKHSLYRGSGARGLSTGSIGREKTLQEGIGWISAY
jgi:hypothetical protein